MKMNSWIKWMTPIGRNDLSWGMAQEAKQSGSRGGGVRLANWCDHLPETCGIIYSCIYSFSPHPMLDFTE